MIIVLEHFLIAKGRVICVRFYRICSCKVLIAYYYVKDAADLSLLIGSFGMVLFAWAASTLQTVLENKTRRQKVTENVLLLLKENIRRMSSEKVTSLRNTSYISLFVSLISVGFIWLYMLPDAGTLFNIYRVLLLPFLFAMGAWLWGDRWSVENAASHAFIFKFLTWALFFVYATTLIYLKFQA